MDQRNLVEVFIIDDANELRNVLEAFLQRQPSIQLVGSTTCVEDAFGLAQKQSPQVILLGVRSTIRADVIYLRHKLPQAGILLLGSLEGSGSRMVAANVGADGYLDKDDLVEKLVPEVRRLAQRQDASIEAGIKGK